MSKLYFGVCPYGTICDVLVATLAGWSKHWLQPCIPEITSSGHLIHKHHSDYVINLSDNNPMSFRDIDWSDKLTRLELLLQSTDKKIWVGTFHPNQISIVKNYFGNEVTTVGVQYNVQTRYLILENVLTYYQLHDIKNTDKYNLEIENKYFADQDNWDLLVPPVFDPKADIIFHVEDFLVPTNFINQLVDFDGDRNKDQLLYYDTWLTRTKKRLVDADNALLYNTSNAVLAQLVEQRTCNA